MTIFDEDPSVLKRRKVAVYERAITALIHQSGWFWFTVWKADHDPASGPALRALAYDYVRDEAALIQFAATLEDNGQKIIDSVDLDILKLTSEMAHALAFTHAEAEAQRQAQLDTVEDKFRFLIYALREQ